MKDIDKVFKNPNSFSYLPLIEIDGFCFHRDTWSPFGEFFYFYDGITWRAYTNNTVKKFIRKKKLEKLRN
jgi:hypothetical protein